MGETRSPEAAAAVRKVVTILFADLSGSTALQERLDAETTRRVMDRVHRLLADSVAAHAGRVVKFTGDGLMAVFGIPVLREDDALRAVRAGAAMQESFATLATELQRDLGADIGLRVGINTGEVVVAPDTDDIVGDPVNVAARLEAAAAVGEVLIGVETGRLVRDVIAVEAVPALALKGKELPVAAMRLAASEVETSAATTAFVGREADLERLVSVFDQALALGRARLVTVVGSPGLGKSRLASEVATRLSDRATVLEARCTPSGGSSFGPVVDAIRFVLGLDESANESTVREAVTARCFRLADDAERVAATVAALVAGSPAGSAEQLFWSVRRLFEALAQDRPIVLLVDDVHWAEPALLDLVEHIAEWARGGPMLVLALARPELRERRPTLLEAGGPSAAVIVLGALDDAAARHLALDLLATDDLPGGVLARALEASEGNPLFLRELIRLLVDDGVLRRVDGRWRATVDEGGIELPATIHAALAARIEQMRPAERTLLETASVIGRHFPRGALLALLPEDVAADLDSHLDALRRRELVDAESTWWANDRLYRFHHALIRDAAYRRILKEVRADLHARYSTWLETVAEAVSEQDEALGWHLEQAHGFRVELGQLYDEETGRLAERASTHLANAARRAFDRDDVSSAASLLGRALLLVPADDPRRLSLMRGHCDALIACGDMEAAALAVAELVASASTDHAAAIADVFEAQLAGQRSPDELRSVAERTGRAAKVFAEHGDDTGVAHTELVLASAMAALGQVAACEAALDRALAAARRNDDRRRANAVLALAPLAALWGPSPVARASGRCLDVIRVLRITSWAPHVEAHALRAQAVLEALRDRPEASRRMIESARGTFVDLGQPLGLLEVETHAGIVELLAGEPAAAELHLRRAREGFNELGSRVGAARATALLARALLELDRLDEAAGLADPAVGGDDLKATIGLLGVRAEVLARRNDVVEAERLARRAVEIASGTDALLDHADARLALSRVLAAAGRGTEASAEAARARDLYEAKGAVVGVRRAGASPSASAAHASPVVRRRARPNAVSRYVEEAFAAVKSGDISGVAQRYYTPDSLYVHHLTGEELRGDEQLVAMAEYARRREFDFVHEVLLTFDERLALYRLRIESTEARQVGESFDPVGSTELEIVLVAELDEAGKVVRTDVFPPNRLDQASALAFARHAELTTDPAEAAAARALSGTSAFFELVNTGAWSDLEAMFSPAVEAIDHRLASTHLSGRDDWMSYLRSAFELAGTARFDLSDLLAVDVRRGVALAGTRIHGRLADAGAFDMPSYFSCVVGADGLVSRVDMFDPEQRDAAFALFDELVGEVASSSPASGPAETAATRVMERWRAAMMAGHPEGIATVYSRDAVAEDRRPMFRIRVEGREAAVAAKMLVAAQSGIDIQCEPVATRGERLVLMRTAYVGPTYHVEILNLFESDESGQHLVRTVAFEPEQEDAAYSELDRRADELADDGGTAYRVAASVAVAYGTGDVESLRDCFAPDAVIVDHRPARFGAATSDEFVELASALFSLAETTALRIIEVPVATPRATVFRMRTTGRMSGGTFENESWAFGVFEAGRLERFELFAPEGRSEAEARLAELTRVDAALSPNSASRHMERWCDAINRGDPDGVAALSCPDVLTLDRRRLVGSTMDAADTIANASWLANRRDLEIHFVLLATRGDRLALARQEYRHPLSHVETLALHEVTADGALAQRGVIFDADDQDAAFAELDARAIALAGGLGSVLSVAFRVVDASRDRDIDSLRECYAPDAVIVDHGRARFGIATREDFLDRARALFSLAESTSLRIIEVPIVTPFGCIVHVRTSGRTPERADFDSEHWAVGRVHDGRITRLEQFPVDARAEAEACLTRMASPSASSGPSPNAAILHFGEFVVALNASDAAALRAMCLPDIQLEDRRPIIGAPSHGVDAAVENWMFVANRAGQRLHWEPIATRGARLALVRVEYSDLGMELDRLVVVELANDEVRCQRRVVFAVDDEDAAFAELEERAAALEESSDDGRPAENAASRHAERFHAAVSSGDAEAITRLFAPGTVVDDRRRLVGITTSGESSFESARLLAELDGLTLSGEPVATRGQRLVLLRQRFVHRSRAVIETLTVHQVDESGELLDLAVMFDPEDENAAFAELDARALEIEGDVFLPLVSFVADYNAQDLDRLGSWFHADCSFVNHAPAGWGSFTTAEYLAYSQSLFDLTDDARVRPLEVAAAETWGFLTRFRMSGRRDGGYFAQDAWIVTGLRDGRIFRHEQFLIEQLVDAEACFASLERPD